MKILGIDPGTVIMGYGLIECEGSDIALIDYGAIAVPDKLKSGERLNYLYKELLKVMRLHKPDVAAIESPFVAKNVKSAMAIGRAQAIAQLAAAREKIPTQEYPPAKVKQRVASYGASSKEQVQEMVRIQLGLAEIPQPNDAADALAVAICHAQEIHMNEIFAEQEER